MTKLLRTESAARRLGVPATWLRAEVEAGRLPALRAGASLLFDVELVERELLARARAVSPKREGGAP